MIGRLTGRIVHCEGKQVTIDVNGVGYDVTLHFDPTKELEALFIVDVYTHVRETEIKLFGFEDKRSKELFMLLMTVSQVGPAVALALLGLGYNEVLSAIYQKQPQRLTQADGVGKKTAERVVFELEEKKLKALVERFGGPRLQAAQPEVAKKEVPESMYSDDQVSAVANLVPGGKRAALELLRKKGVEPSDDIATTVRKALAKG